MVQSLQGHFQKNNVFVWTVPNNPVRPGISIGLELLDWIQIELNTSVNNLSAHIENCFTQTTFEYNLDLFYFYTYGILNYSGCFHRLLDPL